ncbi:hypothetical protein DY000_02055575 [Brassica cretica]|uniref:Syntaxin N-terminal domain-containing protein n=1 Tax=Brassica cretica TaxID=69181 RepID=A0ABQ7AA30_BRACR|nr:hypothetical protein DY000_02055575 [Brassica cretica]
MSSRRCWAIRDTCRHVITEVLGNSRDVSTCQTDFAEITDPVKKNDYFLAKTNTHLSDIIGELNAIRHKLNDASHDKERVMETTRIQKLHSFSVDLKVIVATSLNPLKL